MGAAFIQRSRNAMQSTKLGHHLWMLLLLTAVTLG
jgi:hypothetical protein